VSCAFLLLLERGKERERKGERKRNDDCLSWCRSRTARADAKPLGKNKKKNTDAYVMSDHVKAGSFDDAGQTFIFIYERSDFKFYFFIFYLKKNTF